MDSSAQSASVSLCDGEKQIAGMTLDNGNKHSETLLPMAEDIFRHTGLSADNVDLFAVTVGPGSFTGVRIGVSLVKGMAFGKNKPCVGVSSLESLAFNMIGTDGVVCSLIDARHEQYYNAFFRVKSGTLTRLCPDRIITLKDLANELADFDEKVCLVGDGANSVSEYLLENDIKSNVKTPQNYLMLQNGYSVAMVAERMYEEGKYTSDRLLVPVYLRASQAERERLEKIGNTEISAR